MWFNGMDEYSEFPQFGQDIFEWAYNNEAPSVNAARDSGSE
jgi:hypothetical protein